MNENILVNSRMTLTQKNRVSLVKSTGAKPGDKLVLIFRKKYLEVKELNQLINELKSLKERLNNASNLEMLNFYQDNIDLITSCISNIVEVDNQGRIILNPEIVSRYNLSNEITIEGTLDGFRVWNPTEFEIYRDEKLNKFIRK